MFSLPIYEKCGPKVIVYCNEYISAINFYKLFYNLSSNISLQ